MPGMITKHDEENCIRPLQDIATREYRRGLIQGWNIARDAVIWLRTVRGGRFTPAYTHEKIAEMIEASIKREMEREGL